MFGMWHFISTNALSLVAKKEAVGDASAALSPDVSHVVFPPPLTVPGAQADLGEPQPTGRDLVLGSGWGCWDVWS